MPVKEGRRSSAVGVERAGCIDRHRRREPKVVVVVGIVPLDDGDKTRDSNFDAFKHSAFERSLKQPVSSKQQKLKAAGIVMCPNAWVFNDFI